jgi:hypothetical protein
MDCDHHITHQLYCGDARMSSSVDKTYGNLYIFGKYPNADYVDVNWSVSQDTIIERVSESQAKELIGAWDNLLDFAEQQYFKKTAMSKITGIEQLLDEFFTEASINKEDGWTHSRMSKRVHKELIAKYTKLIKELK